MIRCLLARLLRIDLAGVWTAPSRGGGPLLDHELDERDRRNARAPRCLP